MEQIDWDAAKDIILKDGVNKMAETILKLKDEKVRYIDIAGLSGKERLIHSLVDAKWAIDHPEDFIVCRCTVEADYEKASKNHAYKWYIAAMNGRFDPTDAYGISDKAGHMWMNAYEAQHVVSPEDVTNAWRAEFRKRIDCLIDEILTCGDIRLYVIQHFSI